MHDPNSAMFDLVHAASIMEVKRKVALMLKLCVSLSRRGSAAQLYIEARGTSTAS